MSDRQLRVGEDDRDAVVALLTEQYVEGRLTFEELEARVGQALSAVTRGDLAALTADLPVARPDVRAAGPGRRSVTTAHASAGPSVRHVVERLLVLSGASVVAAVLLAWGIAQAQDPPPSTIVCGPYVNADCYWPAESEPVDY